ncbi:MAG TPA: hypothetical protein VKZ53_02900 [Candidatus Angelobacter sp.]|nr:hypothetical protein [Candidatus Angelobacter sp.]
MSSADEAGRRKDLMTQRWLAIGAGVGFAYGIIIRLIAQGKGDYGVMTAAFVCAMPFALGFLSVFLAEIKQPTRIWIRCLLPWVPLASALGVMMLVLLEGSICVILFAPIGMVRATLGGIAAGVVGGMVRSRRSRHMTLGCVALLPFLIVPWEGHVLHRLEMRDVENVIDIHAPAEVVWKNIERVPLIRKDELGFSWSRSIGLPDPLEATLSHEGIGGVRQASFERGLSFVETVDVWEPQQRLAFSIRANPIPRETLDEHVTVGGPYFDVLRGGYRLEPLPNGTLRLHLSSQHRLSTDFNWYAHIWTDAMMSDLQSNILLVIRKRCERLAH